MFDYTITIGTIIALAALAFVIYFEYRRDVNAKKAVINSLFEEILTNIKLSDIFIRADDRFVQRIAKVLEKYYKENGAPRVKWTYPNPTDLFEDIKHKPKESIFLGLERLISNIKLPPDKNETYFFKYQFFSLENSLSSGTIWNYAGDRISLNLRDLYYSLKRIDKAKADYLENRIAIPTGIDFKIFEKIGLNISQPFDKLIYQYWLWLHFRLWFSYIDLALSTRKGLIKHTSMRFIKNALGDDEYKRLNKVLRKTIRNYYKIE